MAGQFRRVREGAIYGVRVIVLLSLTLVVQGQHIQQSQHRSRSKSSTTKPVNTDWYKFKGPDKDFILDFPTRPKRVEDVQGPVTVLRRYAVATDTMYFEISIQDFGGAPGSPEANSLSPKFEQTMSEMLGEDGIKIVQLRRMTKGSYELEMWSPALTPGDYLHALQRGILRNGRNYAMRCGSLVIGQEVNRAVCHRFFNSFRIIGIP
jgi:hypothetical protein